MIIESTRRYKRPKVENFLKDRRLRHSEVIKLCKNLQLCLNSNLVQSKEIIKDHIVHRKLNKLGFCESDSMTK